MAVPVHKLPQLLKVPFLLPKFSKLVFTYAPHKFVKNNPRYYYKSQAPLIKYYNSHLQVVLSLVKDAEPKIEAFQGDQLVGEIPNSVPVTDIPAELEKLHASVKSEN